RRRHTRWPRDWSSDVCSSDLCLIIIQQRPSLLFVSSQPRFDCAGGVVGPMDQLGLRMQIAHIINPRRSEINVVDFTANWTVATRSEERRVGKEGRYRVWVEQY